MGNEARSNPTAAVIASDSCARRKNTRILAPDVSDSKLGEVSYFREETCKENGRYSGASRVRHDRCSFSTVSHVGVGGRKHCLQIHCVRTVHKDFQRGRAEAKWPSKATWRRERDRDRWDRWSTLMLP